MTALVLVPPSLENGALRVDFPLQWKGALCATFRAFVTSHQTLGQGGRTITVQSLHDPHVLAHGTRLELGEQALEVLLAPLRAQPDWRGVLPQARLTLPGTRLVVADNEQFRLARFLERHARAPDTVPLFHPLRLAPTTMAV